MPSLPAAFGDIRALLLALDRSTTPIDLTPTLAPEASKLVAEDSFAFFLASALDRGMKAEIAWTIPYWLSQILDGLDPHRLASMTEADISVLVDQLPKKPRYRQAAARTIRELAQIVVSEFGGNADAIWRGRTATEVQTTLRRVHGVGPGIASMAVILLQRDKAADFPDWNTVNVKPDVHVQRVLFRLGVATERSEIQASVAAARLSPDFPAAVDTPLWDIGRRWCKETGPDCANCWMTSLCPRTGVGTVQ